MKKLCCNCGGLIAKKTISVHFGMKAGVPRGEWWIDLPDKPRNKAEAQKFCNHPLVSVQYSRPNHADPDCYVQTATFWDGKSFKDDYFCSIRCAAEYGYSAVLRKEAAE